LKVERGSQPVPEVARVVAASLDATRKESRGVEISGKTQ
jgi:hypothetical protein